MGRTNDSPTKPNKGESPVEENARKVYEQRFIHHRHLDMLRWQVAGVIATLGYFVLRGGFDKQPIPSPLVVLIFYGAFAGVCVSFLRRLRVQLAENAPALQAAATL